MIAYAALAVISAATLAYEVLLVRLFAIVQWHHFASMAISIALLGFGVSGALLAIWRDRVRLHFAPIFAIAKGNDWTVDDRKHGERSGALADELRAGHREGRGKALEVGDPQGEPLSRQDCPDRQRQCRHTRRQSRPEYALVVQDY